MLSWKSGAERLARVAFGACLALGLAQTAMAEVYAWRTEDGGYAYTDDRDQIPAKYRAQAKLLKGTSLAGYERYTPQDPKASSQYAERLERRLESLRAANAGAPHAASAASHRNDDGANAGTVLVSTGGQNALSVPMQTGANGEPVVIEELTTKRSGDPRTRRSTVVRQGDKVVTVILGEPHVHDVNDFKDEDALAAGDLD
jgi:uncharacterized protein DUF4124